MRGVGRLVEALRDAARRAHWQFTHAAALIAASREESRRRALRDICEQHQTALTGYRRPASRYDPARRNNGEYRVLE